MTGPECTPTGAGGRRTDRPLAWRRSSRARDRRRERHGHRAARAFRPRPCTHRRWSWSFETAFGSKLVKAGEESAEHTDHFVGWETRRQPCEPDDVGKEHSDGRILIGDRPLAGEKQRQTERAGVVTRGVAVQPIRGSPAWGRSEGRLIADSRWNGCARSPNCCSRALLRCDVSLPSPRRLPERASSSGPFCWLSLMCSYIALWPGDALHGRVMGLAGSISPSFGVR